MNKLAGIKYVGYFNTDRAISSNIGDNDMKIAILCAGRLANEGASDDIL